MNLSMIIPLVGQLLMLGFKIADIIEKAENVNLEDKAAMKAAIKKAQSGPARWTVPKDVKALAKDMPLAEKYKMELTGLYLSEKMPFEEFKANIQVFERWNVEKSKAAREGLEVSIKRTLERYGVEA